MKQYAFFSCHWLHSIYSSLESEILSLENNRSQDVDVPGMARNFRAAILDDYMYISVDHRQYMLLNQ